MADKWDNVKANQPQDVIITKREIFAAMSMQGILSSADVFYGEAPSYIAKRAVDYADALIAELAKMAPKP